MFFGVELGEAITGVLIQFVLKLCVCFFSALLITMKANEGGPRSAIETKAKQSEVGKDKYDYEMATTSLYHLFPYLYFRCERPWQAIFRLDAAISTLGVLLFFLFILLRFIFRHLILFIDQSIVVSF